MSNIQRPLPKEDNVRLLHLGDTCKNCDEYMPVIKITELEICGFNCKLYTTIRYRKNVPFEDKFLLQRDVSTTDHHCNHAMFDLKYTYEELIDEAQLKDFLNRKLKKKLDRSAGKK